ncbi:uncharacterized protein LOC143055241 [Mytilus galloprovincialis]|uniref:uncharacterized protein LOC143055241 n=1 Tax=Mytilus galloprovincialis TaxID=29158 RepID=UPI003F7C6F4B
MSPSTTLRLLQIPSPTQQLIPLHSVASLRSVNRENNVKNSEHFNRRVILSQVAIKTNHNHVVLPGTLVAVQLTAHVKNQAVNNIHQPASTIVDTAYVQHADPELPEGSRPKVTNLLRTCNRVRQKLRPEEPHDLYFELAYNFVPPGFTAKDIHVDFYRHLVFFTDQQLKVLSTARSWYLDGTFKVVRNPFAQMFSIHAFLTSGGSTKQVPLAFCMMSRRLTRDYKAVLSAVVSSMPRRPAVQVAVVDFEKGM